MLLPHAFIEAVLRPAGNTLPVTYKLYPADLLYAGASDDATSPVGAVTSDLSHNDLNLAEERASLPPLKLHQQDASRDPSASQPLERQTPTEVARSKPGRRGKPAALAASGKANSKQIGSMGQLAGVAAMGMAAGIVASGVSVELADAAVISAFIAAGGTCLPS